MENWDHSLSKFYFWVKSQDSAELKSRFEKCLDERFIRQFRQDVLVYQDKAELERQMSDSLITENFSIGICFMCRNVMEYTVSPYATPHEIQRFLNTKLAALQQDKQKICHLFSTQDDTNKVFLELQRINGAIKVCETLLAYIEQYELSREKSLIS
jgi:hypothetical protein